MMDIRKYIAAASRTYNYRLRTVVEINDEVLSQIEDALLKYDPVDMTSPRKTMFQASPLDFVGVKNAEVWMIDFETSFPGSKEVMEQEIADAIGTVRRFVVVRTPNEPTELETTRLNAEKEMAEEAEKGNLARVSLLATADTNPEAADIDTATLYGDAYNKKFLGYVASVSAEKAEAAKVEAVNPLFTWLNRPKGEVETTDFNADFDTVKPVSGGTAPTGDQGPDRTAYGNFDDAKKGLRRSYKSMGGKAKTITVEPDTNREVR